MKKLFLLSAALCALSAQGAVQLPSMIGNNMVLQQNSKANLWGKAAPGAKIEVTPSWDGRSYSCKAGADSIWNVAVDTPRGGYTPYSITFSDGEATTVDNVLIGEVWLASGQSNMQMPLKGFDGCPVRGGFDDIAKAATKKDKIRFINIPMLQSYTPWYDTEAAWTVPSPQTAPDYSATAWYFAERLSDVLDVPIGIVSAAYGGARVESWTSREILETYADVSLDPADVEKMTHYLRPLLMYNAMFMPVHRYTYAGIIWYQGCSNVGNHDTYPQRLAAMVDHWRRMIDCGDIPFYAVEIAPYKYGEDGCAGALLREAQWKSIQLIPNSGMISTNDLAEPFELYNIHPSNKSGVGHRLGDLALNRTYGQQQMPASHPRFKSMEAHDGTLRVVIDAPTGGICRNYDIRGFEVAGADRVFHPADKVFHDWMNGYLVISSSEVPEPVALRYCFADFMPGTMYGGNFLPLVPFRTDDWE